MAKGVEITFYDENDNLVTNTSGLTVAWYDVNNINYLGPPLGLARNLSTDADGVLKLDLTLCSGRSIGDDGYLIVRKEDPNDHRESLCFQGRVTLSDVTNGQKVWFHSGWERPEEWPDLDEPEDGIQRIQALIAVQKFCNDKTPVALACQSNYTVDWGDGSSPQNFSSGSTATHFYDPQNTYLTDTSYGYRCAVMTITPQSGHNLTSISFDMAPSGYPTDYRSPILELVVNSSYLTSLTTWTENGTTERIIIGQHGFQTQTFPGYRALRHLEFRGDCSSFTSLKDFIARCVNLLRFPVLPGIEYADIGSISRMCEYCYAIKTLPYFDFSSKNIASATNVFQYCTSLISIPGIKLPSSRLYDCTYMFYNCLSLRYVGEVDTRRAVYGTYLYTDCPSLRYIDRISTYLPISIPAYKPMLQYIGFVNTPGISFTVENNCLGANALNAIFTALPRVSGQTITVTGNPGINQPGYDPTIATSKGWTVAA